MRTTFRFTAAAAGLVLLLTACTEEKAQALLAAAQRFNSEAQAALTATAKLYQFDATPTDLIMTTSADATLAQAMAGRLSSDSYLKLLNLPYRQQARLKLIDQQIEGLGTRYQAFEQSLADLPRATLTAARLVPCTADYGALVTRDLSTLGERVQALPDSGFIALDEVTSKMRWTAQQVKAEQAKAGGGDADRLTLLRSQFDQLQQQAVSLNQQRHQLAEAATTQLAVAVAAGDQAVALARDYDRLDVATLLSLVNDGLTQANALAKGRLNDSLEVLVKFKTKQDTDPYWKRVAGMTMDDSRATCHRTEN